MLEDQDFSNPLPLFALGPEFFYDKKGPLGLDVDTIILFRDRIRLKSPFTFAWFSLAKSSFCDIEELEKDLYDLGIKIQLKVLVDPANEQSVAAAKKFACLADFIFSPELAQKVALTNAPKVSKAKVLTALEMFSCTSSVYDKSVFYNLLVV
jgi:hypothetical protein